MKQIIQIGAEAVLYREGGSLIKERVKKVYRIEEIDKPLRVKRTKREAKVMEKAACNVPKVFRVDEKKAAIEMEFLDGPVLKGVIDDARDKEKICRSFAGQIARLHDAGIIHGDLTTSNAMLKNEEVYIIDFGLSFFSHKVEDKAVDLKLLKQALESKHYKNAKVFEKWILDKYKKTAREGAEVMERLKKVEERGRYKRRQKNY